ncbi:MAG: hypothetical protein Q9M82_01960 [Mariprofundus sp.]|nr:hypothetical protein [Mariprofundus sp.]
MYKFAGIMTTKYSFHCLGFFMAFFIAGCAQAQSDEHSKLGDTNDCTNISVDYANNPNLTRQETIELMDKALLHSLNKYEGCQSIRTSAAASGGGTRGGGTNAGGTSGSKTGAGEDAGNSGSGVSTASSEMSGTQTPAAQESSTENLSDNLIDNLSDKADATPSNAGQGKHAQSTQIKGSGKIPDDIPAVDNDSILEAQIRQAAMNETNPAIKAKLWNEYRKYKGLPVQ